MKGNFIMKKIISVLLLLSMLITCFAGCAKDDAPKGYQLVSGEDEIFELYAPKTWVSNLSSGVSGAYYSLQDNIVVSAKTIRNATNYTLGQFMTLAIESYEAMDGYELVSSYESTTLGGEPAYVMEYKATIKDKDENGEVKDVVYKFKSVIVKFEATLTMLIYSAPVENYDTAIADFDGIMANFAFKTFAEGEIEKDDFTVLVDENTPEGFHLASKDKYEFRFYVPLTWTVQRRAYNPSAYFAKNDLSNVSVSSKVLSDDITDGASYWQYYTETTSFKLSDIVIDENAKMGGHDAYAVEYLATASGLKYRIKQVFLTAGNMIYIFTYTSDRVHYEKHLDDVNSMIELFEFKK